jgi:hypothetical protein
MTRLSGRVPETGTAISGATVAIIDTQGTDDTTQWSIVASDTTDANGEWSVSGLEPSAVERYHAVAQFDSGVEFVNFESLPFLSTPADAFAPTTSVDVGTPTASVSVGSAIPDTVGNRWTRTKTGVSDGQTVDPWPDAEGSVDLTANGEPFLNSGSVNGNDAVDLNGTDETYQYDTNLSSDINEPCSVLWAFNIETLPTSGITALWEDDARQLLIRTDDDNWRLANFNGNTATSTVGASTGDYVVSFLVDESTAEIRINGSNEISVASTTDIKVLSSSVTGSWFGDEANNRRYLDALSVETVVHPNTRLTGNDLTSEEQRLEDAADMDVLS